jgi:outer membrane protein assembly factor BamA
LTGFKAGGVGLVINHDSRDIVDAPKTGWYLNVNNIAYRQSIEGSNNFNVYRADYRQYWSHGDGNVFAVRQSNQWTADAPPGAYAPVLLRGYTTGEYLGKYMSSLEVEERHRLASRWTATVFAGVACLYGASRNGCADSANRFPSAGLGVQYILKPAQGIVANMEFAFGKEGNKALLFKMGYGW